MEVILVNPSGGTSWQDRNKKSEKEQYMYPYSLIYLQNYLNKHDISSRMFDLYYMDPAILIDHCKTLNAPIVGLTSQTYNRDNTIETVRQIKAVSPDATIVVGGKHFTYCPEQTLQEIDVIDFVVRGEGEITFYELVKALQTNGPLDGIEGITYRKDGSVVSNSDRELERDIDKFTLDYDKLPQSEFAKGVTLRNFENEAIRSLPVILGRGCSQKCVFCVYRQQKYRVRKLESCLKEIRYLKEHFNQTFFTFSDPSFTERRKFAREFCEALLAENMNIKWYCEARADTPLDLLTLMRDAGCVSLDFAIETGSPKVLKTINKNIVIPQALEFAKNCKELGIRTLVFFMVSLPDETEEDAYMTLDLIKTLSKYTRYITIGTAQVFPGTQMEIMARERGILPDDFNWYDERFYHQYPDLGPVNVPLYLEHLSVDFIRQFLKEFEKIRFTNYSNSADIIRLMKRGAQRIPNQPLSKTISDVGRFSRGIAHKMIKSLSSSGR